MRRTTSILMILLLCTLYFSFRTERAQALDIIYIRADGSIDPDTALIVTVDNVTYTLTGNIINQTIVVERNDTIIDGNGYTLQGSGTGAGLHLLNVRNVTIKNTNIKNFQYGIYGYPSYGSVNHHTILNNIISDNGYGIYLRCFNFGHIIGNTLMGNGEGIWMTFSMSTEIVANNLTGNGKGISTKNCAWTKIVGNSLKGNYVGFDMHAYSWNQTIYHNNLFNNTVHVSSDLSSNFWDDGYPSGGNYWSGYNVTDLYSGPYQNETGSDGIGDSSYAIPGAYDLDNYPLMNPYWNPADINHDLKIDIFDVVLCANAYGSTPSDPHWNPLCDITEPYGIVNIFDVVAVCRSYGEWWN